MKNRLKVKNLFGLFFLGIQILVVNFGVHNNIFIIFIFPLYVISLAIFFLLASEDIAKLWDNTYYKGWKKIAEEIVHGSNKKIPYASTENFQKITQGVKFTKSLISIYQVIFIIFNLYITAYYTLLIQNIHIPILSSNILTIIFILLYLIKLAIEYYYKTLFKSD